jgi:uncharacterized membrane protein
MSDPVLQQLSAVLASQGQAAMGDPGRLEQLLNQTCSAYPGKVKALVILLEKKAVAYLSNWANDKRPERLTFEQVRDGLAKKFADANLLNAPAAAWAIEAWAAALGMRPPAGAAAGASAPAPMRNPVSAPAEPKVASAPAASGLALAAAASAPAGVAAQAAAGERNAYAPPTAAVEDPHQGNGSLGALLPDGRGLPIGRGTSWIGGGWRLFKQSPGVWIGIVLILFVINALAGFLGPVGDLAMFLLNPIFAAGVMLGCRSLEQDEGLELGHLFAGFKANPLKLILVALVYLLVVAGLFIVLSLVFGAGVATSFKAGNYQALIGPIIALVAALVIVGTPIMMAYYYAVGLVTLEDAGVMEAVKGGFSGGFKNILPLLAYSIVMLVLIVLAAIPLLLGLLVMLPVAVASGYASYRDVFYEE